MGYFTDYNLTFDDSFDCSDEVFNYIENSFKIPFSFVDNSGHVTCKWYNHASNMRIVSLKWPDILFELKGSGEENDDLWIKYFKNGKMQACYAEIVYPKFNENEME
jgi:uncharacterized protein YodC (DUF2158 family)